MDQRKPTLEIGANVPPRMRPARRPPTCVPASTGELEAGFDWRLCGATEFRLIIELCRARILDASNDAVVAGSRSMGRIELRPGRRDVDAIATSTHCPKYGDRDSLPYRRFGVFLRLFFRVGENTTSASVL